MDDSVFIQAVNELFPEADQETKIEIIEKVTGHMIEFIKKKVYQDNPHELDALLQKLNSNSSDNEVMAAYIQAITAKLDSLPKNAQEEILQARDAELTRVMHQIYLLYTSK